MTKLLSIIIALTAIGVAMKAHKKIDQVDRQTFNSFQSLIELIRNNDI
ncbi:hypothetical protein [Dolosigranulum pigrum]|nr:hypothetical protein [Dolosigranulum pigrum]